MSIWGAWQAFEEPAERSPGGRVRRRTGTSGGFAGCVHVHALLHLGASRRVVGTGTLTHLAAAAFCEILS